MPRSSSHAGHSPSTCRAPPQQPPDFPLETFYLRLAPQYRERPHRHRSPRPRALTRIGEEESGVGQIAKMGGRVARSATMAAPATSHASIGRAREQQRGNEQRNNNHTNKGAQLGKTLDWITHISRSLRGRPTTKTAPRWFVAPDQYWLTGNSTHTRYRNGSN